MRVIKGTQDGHHFGLRLFLDPWVLGARSVELSFGRWYVGVEWGAK